MPLNRKIPPTRWAVVAALSLFLTGCKKAPVTPTAEAVKPPVTAGPQATEKSGEFGNWIVRTEVDPMTDEKTCVAFYKPNKYVQAGRDTLYVSYKGRGGLKSYVTRFDDQPADKMALPNDAEKSMDLIVLKEAFDKAYSGARLRVQTLTILDTLVNEDIDLTGLRGAVDKMRADCPFNK